MYVRNFWKIIKTVVMVWEVLKSTSFFSIFVREFLYITIIHYYYPLTLGGEKKIILYYNIKRKKYCFIYKLWIILWLMLTNITMIISFSRSNFWFIERSKIIKAPLLQRLTLELYLFYEHYPAEKESPLRNTLTLAFFFCSFHRKVIVLDHYNNKIIIR